MTKKVIAVLIIFFSLGVFLLFLNNSKDNNDIKQNPDNGIAVMVYDEEKSDYIKSDSYPIGSYTLNLEKSTCTGSKDGIIYNSETGVVSYPANVSNKCTLYFDPKKIINFRIDDDNCICSAYEGDTWSEWSKRIPGNKTLKEICSKGCRDAFFHWYDSINTGAPALGYIGQNRVAVKGDDLIKEEKYNIYINYSGGAN